MSYRTERKKMLELKPGDLWVQGYFGGDVTRMFIGTLDEPLVETLWDDLIEVHFEEKFVWVVSLVMGSGMWLQKSALHIEAYPENAPFDVVYWTFKNV